MARNEDTPQEGNNRPRGNSWAQGKKVFGRGTRFDRPEGGDREGGFRNRERNSENSDRPYGNRDRAERPRRDDRDGDINTNRENRERAPRRESDRRGGDFRPARGFERPDRGNNDRPDFRPRGENDRRASREGGFNRGEGRGNRNGGFSQDNWESGTNANRGGERGERRSFGNREDRGASRGGDRPSYGAAREDRGGDRREGGFRKPGFSSDRNDRGFNRSEDRRERSGDREDRGFTRGGDRREDRGFNRANDRENRAPRENNSFSGNEGENNFERPARREGERSFDRAPRENRGPGERSSFQRRDSKFDRGSRPERNDRADRGARGNKEGRFGRTDEETQEAPSYNLKRYEERRKRKSPDQGNEDLRLNRYIANAGICSRREADELIAAGEIKVNGQVVTEMGYKVGPTDTVQYGRKILNREKTVYVLLNKPKDFLTTTEDPEGRKTVMELVKNASKERLFPVGRLDRNTTGLLLFTNDGELAQKLTHPSNKVSKIYQVELDKPITQEHVKQIQEGLELEDGRADVDDIALLGESNKFLGIEIHIGRNRIVRRIFEHLGYEVVALDRVQYAGLTKKDLPRGNWRYLTEKEVVRLKYFM
ncbi:pseudouridine synthase [Sabulibacter ruber]|uniref:pseudouridine synthase n=1 Tax=Sabulibacter ruber TaxID=2811901 RepID=UPI001A960AEA|nr:pseudouridine synthase [Sabulibacter ruber]